MEEAQHRADDGVKSLCQISDLPEEILEYIFMKVSPYKDLKSTALVCVHWARIVKAVIKKLFQNYIASVHSARLKWLPIKPDAGSRITERYSHCCAYYEKSLYVFGGCTATNTTLNDLWRFDLAAREWIRPLAMGTYPFPKACASLVVYRDNLVLFGGWSHPTPFPLHQAARFFSELHIYKPDLNRWSHVITLSHQSPQPVAGHSASVLGDHMVVFGGSQVPGVRTNELWTFDFNESVWHMPRTNSLKPAPRYGQTQITIDEKHILFLGGCGGPNQVFNDIWLLTVDQPEWRWQEVTIDNMDFAPPQLWCHSACKIGSAIVSLSKPAKSPKTPPSSPRVTKLHNRARAANRGEVPSTSGQATLTQNEEPSTPSYPDCDDEDASEVAASTSTVVTYEPRTANPRPGLPSIRPNAMNNRQRQLESLLKYEKKLRQSRTTIDSVSPENTASQNVYTSRKTSRNLASQMVLHVLDISELLEKNRVSWQPLSYNMPGAPDETIFYSLVEGRNELLMFGGIERDITSLQRGMSMKSHTVNNILYTLSPLIQKL